MTEKKSGFISIIGHPNVGKSTLVNAFLGQKIAAVTPKAQTTRRRQMGILTTAEYQLVFLDTPGIHNPHHKLGDFLNQEAEDAMRNVDVILWLVDAMEGPSDFVTSTKIYEVAQNSTRTHHIFTEGSIMSSARRMATLSPENQKVIRDAARRAVQVEMWEANLVVQTNAWNELTSRTKAIADPDLPSFREKMGPLVDGFVAKTGAKGKAFVDGTRAAV